MPHLRSMLTLCLLLTAAVTLTLTAGCSDTSEPARTADGKQAVTLALNWVPEPEFGGFYAALESGQYASQGLDVTIKPGGAGAPVIQQIATGKVPFGIVSADEIVIARSRGAKVVAIFTSYQTCPQGIMVHSDRNIESLEQLFKTPGTIAMEPGLPYGKFLTKKYPPASDVKIVPYTGGVAQFLNDKTYSQQGFIFSEPVTARRQGANPRFFLTAEAGYDPYTVVVATSEAFLEKHPQLVKSFVAATRKGWELYLADPSAANAVMGKLNTTMDAQSFKEAAESHTHLIENDHTRANGLGSMTLERWETLSLQLVELGVIDTAVPASECFRTLD
jgi:NitT/TauT family transport system substrate-binding protein